MFFNYFKSILLIFLLIILVPTMFIPTIVSSANSNLGDINFKKEIIDISNSAFCWPVPGYTRISSYFGKRNSPTLGASLYHLGLDIPAHNGTNIIAPVNSKVTFIGFKGSGGYSIVLKSENLEFIYHHVSPDYIVSVGDNVYKGQIIGKVRT